MKMYEELADWWPLVSAPEDYAEEAAEYVRLLRSGGDTRTVLELGSGGGNNASHLKRHFSLTLVEPADGMRAHSEKLNPECRHVAGDMRLVRLHEVFDAVFVHDAVQYMTSEADLTAMLETVAAHLKPGGVAVIVPDATLETFRTEAKLHEGNRDGRELRYIEWSLPPRDGGTLFEAHYAFLMREADGSVRCAHDVHREGVFSRATWLRLCEQEGLQARIESAPIDEGQLYDVIVARKM